VYKRQPQPLPGWPDPEAGDRAAAATPPPAEGP
jgi:hypothetical protein